MSAIKNVRHIWFDFTDTIASMDKAAFDDLIYSSYAEVTKRDITQELIEEYKALLKQHKSNSAVFSSLGMPAGYLSDRANGQKSLCRLTDKAIPTVIEHLRNAMPVSIFSNTRLDTLLPTLGIKREWITHLLGPDLVKKPKPALDGFYMIVELSKVPPEEILYVGDDVEKDLAPAKQVGMQTGLMWKKSPDAHHCFANFSEIVERLA